MPQLFKVGGCVRDKLLGLDSKDIDFTFVCDDVDQPINQGWEEMRQFLNKEGFEIFLETPECFTIRAKFPKEHQFEGLIADFVMARKEIGYEEGTRRPILELGSLEDDLIRRDFTVNALAEDINGKLIDLFGGVNDLHLQVLKTPQDAIITFMDDPLRMLRALRFSITKNLRISVDIWEAMEQPQLLEKLQQTVSSERIREELHKMFAFDTNRTLGLLMEVDQFVPGFLKVVFKDGLWLKPTFKEKK